MTLAIRLADRRDRLKSAGAGTFLDYAADPDITRFETRAIKVFGPISHCLTVGVGLSLIIILIFLNFLIPYPLIGGGHGQGGVDRGGHAQ